MYNMGKINPDLLVLLIEPTVYILMALCERADVDFTIDGSIGEEDELDNVPDNMKTKEGYLKDGFIVDNDDDDIDGDIDDNGFLPAAALTLATL